MGRPKGSRNKSSIEKWGDLPALYPEHYRHLRLIHDRAHDTCGVYYEWSGSGLLEFVEELGPYPEHMNWATVGRKDHSLGYVPGNIMWQEMSENSRESIVRSGLGAPGAGLGRTLPTATCEKLSAARAGKTWSEARRKASRFDGLEPELVSDLMSLLAKNQKTGPNGKKDTDETRRRKSLAHKDKPWSEKRRAASA